MMTQYVECDECAGERHIVLFGRKELCDICDGEGYLPMPEIPHIQRVEATEDDK